MLKFFKKLFESVKGAIVAPDVVTILVTSREEVWKAIAAGRAARKALLEEVRDPQGCTEIMGEGLKYLSGLTNLQRLDLEDTTTEGTPAITDAGLIHLESLWPGMKLDLSGSREITDAGLKGLEGLPNIQKISSPGNIGSTIPDWEPFPPVHRTRRSEKRQKADLIAALRSLPGKAYQAAYLGVCSVRLTIGRDWAHRFADACKVLDLKCQEVPAMADQDPTTISVLVRWQPLTHVLTPD